MIVLMVVQIILAYIQQVKGPRFIVPKAIRCKDKNVHQYEFTIPAAVIN